MIKRIIAFTMLSLVYLFARGDAPLVFEDTPVINDIHKKVYHHKKHYKKVYKKKYKKHSTYKRYKTRKNDALIAKDELILPTN